MPKPKLSSASFAVSTRGELFLNITNQIDPRSLARLAEAGGLNEGRVFVGVQIAQREADVVWARLQEAGDETAARIVGKKRRAASKRPPRRTGG